MTFEEKFQQAGKDGKEFRGAPFWSWNDDLDPEELRRQVRSMCESGMGGFFMHARAGLITPYMSQKYIDCHSACIDEAKKLGMNAWLYDEDCWPSGAAGGISAARGELYQTKTVNLDWVSGGETSSCDKTIAVFEYTGERENISGYERVSAGKLSDPSAQNLIVCRWEPDGYVDVMDKGAIAQFIDVTHDVFAKVFSEEFDKTIPGIFTDEPNFNNRAFSTRVPWTLKLVDEFRARMGYDIRDSLLSLYYPIGDYRKVRHDFWRVVTELYVGSFSKQIFDWCADHKLRLTGHYLLEDDLEVQIRHIGAAMPHYEYEQVPGIDHLCRRIADPVLVKQVSSVAHQFGGRRVLSEMFGCSGWNMSFEDQKWIAEWQYVLGVNLMCQHLCLYSLKGWRKRDFPPSVYYQQPWWPQYNTVEDHFSRLACALTSGKHVADVLVIHPIESGWCEFEPLAKSKTVAKLNADFSSISSFLQEFHIDYDYGDESIMERHASVIGNELRVGECSYRLVIVPPTVTLRRSTMDLLETWMKSGGDVIVCGQIPTRIDGAESPEPGVIFEDTPVVPVDFEALKDAVSDVLQPRVQVVDEYGSDARTIYFQQRDLGGKQLFFFANIDNTDVRYDSVIRFRGCGKVEEWDLDTGEITELPCREIGGFTVVEREFAPTQSRLLSFDPTQKPMPAEPERWMVVDEPEIEGPWTLRRKDMNALTVDFCRYKIGNGEFSDLTPTIWLGARLSNIEEETPVTLQYEFTANFELEMPKDFVLVMEQPEEFEISVNGNKVSYVDSGWWCDVSFKKIPIGLFVQPGKNIIEMTCTYLGEKGRKKRQDQLDVRGLWKRMWMNPPSDAKDPIILPYSGETEKIIKEYNYLKMGLDLESIYILGDFRVVNSESGEYVLTDDDNRVTTGDLSKNGYPFYRGTFVYETSFNYENRDEDKLMLALNDMGGIIARIFVNGEDAGKIKWRPMEVDITGLVKPGANSLRIELTNSCRNLLGPHHHVSGELFGVGPDSFGAEAGYCGVENHCRGAAPEQHMNAWTDKYTFVKTGLTVAPKLVFMRSE